MEEHAGHAMKYYKDKNDTAYMTQVMEYLFPHHMESRIPDDRLDQHPGHPGYADYIRDEFLHAQLFDTPMETAGATAGTTAGVIG